MDEQPPQEIIDWLDEIREKGIQPGLGAGAPKSYFVTAYRPDGTFKQFRTTPETAEQDAELLWKTHRWARIEIDGKTCYEEGKGS